MKEFDFTLVFQLAQSHNNPEDYLDLLYEAGCDDALLGLGKEGYISLNFIRESNSAFTAIKSAIDDVKSVIKSAKLIQVEPDLVGEQDLVNIMEYSRQNIQKIVNKSSFPNPVYKGSQNIWHLAIVLEWLVTNNYEVNQELLETAQLNMSINLSIGNQITQPQTLTQAKTLVCA